MKTLTGIPLLALAKTEYAKDNGIVKREDLENVKLKLIGRNTEGNYTFAVEALRFGRWLESMWELERIDLSRLTKNKLTVSPTVKRLTYNDVSALVGSKTGYALRSYDIASVKKVSGGFEVIISDESLCFTGIFKIKQRNEAELDG